MKRAGADMFRNLRWGVIILLSGTVLTGGACYADVVSSRRTPFAEKTDRAEIVVDGEIVQMKDLSYEINNERNLCGTIYYVAINHRFKGAVGTVLEFSTTRAIYESSVVAPAVGDHVLILATTLRRGESWSSKWDSYEMSRCKSKLGRIAPSDYWESVFQIVRFKPDTPEMLLYSKLHTQWPFKAEASSSGSCADDSRTPGRVCVSWDRVRELLVHTH